MAGPVVAAAAVIRNPKHEIRSPKQISNSKLKLLKRVSNFDIRISNLRLMDSKKLTPKARQKLYKILTTHPSVKWGIGRVYPRVIDRINILQATKLAMKRAVKNLNCKLQIVNCEIDFLILDGKMGLDLPLPQESIVKADEKVFSCAVASIIAKVKRDRAMLRYHKKYPEYGFDQHKGYGTRRHLKMLKKFGRCAIHRNSFQYGGPKTKTYQIKKE